MTGEPTEGAPGGGAIPPGWRAALPGAVIALALVMLTHLRAVATGESLSPLFLWIGAVAGCGAVGGALGGLVGARLRVWRSMHLAAGYGAVRGACFAGAATGLLNLLGPAPEPIHVAELLATVGLGAAAGAVSLFLIHGDSPAYYYGLALLRLHTGDRDGACEAIGWYLIHSHKDPDVATRRPIAERFLRDQHASLNVPTELLAAGAPAGRGTEPEAAATPAGRGTEVERASDPSDPSYESYAPEAQPTPHERSRA